MKPKILLTLITLSAASLAARAAPPQLTQKALRPAIETYLHEKGKYCLGKYDWPIEVSDGDRRNRSRDAVQMPVLEKVGLVSSSSADQGVARYDLTAEGRKYYVDKQTITRGAGGQAMQHAKDLCAATLVLDRVVSWEAPQDGDGRTQVLVKYTYKVTSAADWTRDSEVARAFPMMHRILEGAGSQQLEQLLNWSGHRWVAVTPGA
jgi:hypothetical protein